MDRTPFSREFTFLGLLCALIISLPHPALANPGDPGTLPLDGVELLSLSGMDHQALLAEDAAAAGPGVPLRFARPRPVMQSPAIDGTWQTLADDSELWRLRVRSPGALSLSFGFTRYAMPAGGTLVVLTPDASTVLGPFTERHGKRHGELWTPILPGGEAVIEVRLPAGSREQLGLELTAVNHGYRDVAGFGVPPEGGQRSKTFEKSGACNVDVACPEGDPWDPQIRSVARIIVGGSSLCTGFLVNNTDQDLRPLFMTADHCGLSAGNAASLVVYWNFFNSTCRPPGGGASGDTGNGSESQVQTGSTFLAGSPVSDFTLVELDQAPAAAYDVHWVGWDARPGDFPSAIGVHHPSGDEKRISFEDDPTTTTSYLEDSAPGDGTHIRVADWDLGTTEGGSSGSPLFDSNGRVIGQLHGGFAACGNNLTDWYGRLSVSWGLGLMPWLDPGTTGALFMDGRDQEPGVLVVPGFEVEVEDPGGPTTFFAVRNTTNDDVQIDVDYHGEQKTGTPLRTDVFMLGPGQTLTQDVRGNLAGLNVSGGLATGLIEIAESGGDAAALTGDYFRIDSNNDFAAGDRLVRSEEFCARQEVRFVDFGSGSRLQILLAEPQGVSAPSFSYTAYNQAGTMLVADDFFTSDHLTALDVGDLVPSQSFGTLVFDFSNAAGGFVTAEYSAFGRFSVELNGACKASVVAQRPSGATSRSQPSLSPPLKRARELAEAKGTAAAPDLRPPPKACVTMDIECNSTVTGTLTADDCDLGDGTVFDEWQFEGTDGDTVTIDMTSVAYDTFLFLLDPSLSIATVDDDGGDGSNSRIVYTLDSTGIWSIWANNFFAGPIGDYALTLVCEGVEPPAGSQLLVPGFEVEVDDPEGPTTFFAVRNTTDDAVEIDVAYHGEQITGTPLRTDVFMLGPRQTLTQNVRGDLSDLNVTGGVASGLIAIQESGGGAANLEGDYFRIDSGNDFATGDRLVRTEQLCDQQEIRFVDFGSGSRLRILLAEPQGAEVPSFRFTAYREAGSEIVAGEVFTTVHLLLVDVGDLVATQSFGTLVFDFSSSGGGFVSAEYSAFGRFSVELGGACVTAPAR